LKRTVCMLVALMMLAALLPTLATAESAIDTSEHVVITYLVTGNVPTDKTEETLAVLNEKLTEKVNAELKLYWIEWTDYMSVYNLTLASQDGNIDLVGTATDWLDAWPNIVNGAFQPLSEEMLQTYAPQTWAQVPAENWELCKYNGQIYLIPEDNYAQWTNHGFMYRGDWAALAGLENGVNSWDEMGVYFKYIKDNMPDVIPWDAKPDASLVTQLAGGWQASHTSNIYIEGLHVDLFYGESVENKTTISDYYIASDEFVNFAKHQKEWAELGVWKEDVLNNTSIDTREEMEQGISGADQHHTQTFISEATEMEEKQPGSDLGFFWFGEETQNLTSLNITHGAMAIARTSKNPERALAVYDLLRNDEEIYRLLCYGIEGVQYVLGEDGKTFTRPEGYVSDTDGSSFNWWWGRNDQLELVSPDVDVAKRDAIYAEYTCAYPYQYGQIIFDLDAIGAELDNLANIYNTYMPQISYGKAADPEAFVAEFRAQLEAAGYSYVVSELEAQLKAVYGE